jgi:phosphatidate cytidylyltransferase
VKKRFLSAGILLTIVFLCVFLSVYTRILLFAVCGILCCYEFSRNLEKLEIYCAAWVMYVYISVQAILAMFHASATFYIACITGGIYLAMFSGIVHKKVSGKGALYTVAGLAYPGVLFGVLMMISASDIWLATMGIAALSTWICDSFALFGGIRFGKHKVAPLVSPNKSIEGCICGALASIALAFLLFVLKLFPQVPLSVMVITCFVSSSLGQIGDLAESLLKRMIGTKDFSDLIPGHGGMFDRADSLLFSIPTAYLCLHIAGIS